MCDDMKIDMQIVKRANKCMKGEKLITVTSNTKVKGQIREGPEGYARFPGLVKLLVRV